LRTSYAIVPATFSICTSHVDNMLHGFNLIVLQQFFSSEELGSLVGSTLTQIEIEADLPAFKTYAPLYPRTPRRYRNWFYYY